MSSSVLSRAREEAMRGSGKYEGEFLENDALIANQLVFLITDVIDDRGGGFNGQDCWRLRVEPFEEGDEAPDGIVTLTDNPARRKFMSVLDKELNELLQKGSDPVIGPCVMVRLKGKNYRFNDIVDWDVNAQRPVLPDGAVLAGQRVEDDMRPQRPRRGQPQPEPEESQRPFAGAVEAKAEAPAASSRPARTVTDRDEEFTEHPPFQTAPDTTGSASAPSVSTAEFPESVSSSAPPKRRSRRAATTEPPTPSIAETAPTEVLTLIEFARKYHGYTRGRVSNEAKAAHEKYLAGQNVPAGAYQGSSDDVERELAIQAAKHAVPEPADVPVSAPNRQMIPGYDDGAHAQQITYKAGMGGTSKEACPSCGKKIHDRIFPTGEPGSNSYALVHARCEAGGEQIMMEALPDIPETN